jgi:hypothetical protein
LPSKTFPDDESRHQAKRRTKGSAQKKSQVKGKAHRNFGPYSLVEKPPYDRETDTRSGNAKRWSEESETREWPQTS